MISIIIPLYNQAKKLDKCLESILKQTYSNYEIIVVNDRSSDCLSKIVEKYKKEFGIKIEFINNSINHGAPYSRNKGFLKSKGEYVIFCDADLELYPDALKTMQNELDNHKEAAYAYPGHIFGHKKFASFEFNKERLKRMPYIHSTALIRRECLLALPWDESLKRLQDWDLWLSLLKKGHKGYWINKILFKVQPGGTMSNWLPSFAYKFLPFLPKVRKYKEAVRIIRKKHKLS
ncbi:glycosyltransferase family 2 protein [Candidatus Parcubacteria bacterium]|nr:glycosyltransferase family 2 protein [Candidatus Parcubacteria bacterium]